MKEFAQDHKDSEKQGHHSNSSWLELQSFSIMSHSIHYSKSQIQKRTAASDTANFS
jgi:hypothetical protein